MTTPLSHEFIFFRQQVAAYRAYRYYGPLVKRNDEIGPPYWLGIPLEHWMGAVFDRTIYNDNQP